MQDWDQLVMALIGAGVAVYSGYLARTAWRQRQRWAAAGHALLGVCTVALPLLVALWRAGEK
ncbi:MAG: hypothetical protein K0R39_332 [Symbiobacteriaceae bacterium]|jgi:hypothetical protein|nr:hypothetical protein [Symbiobacteriaceae bacterium]